MPQQSPTMTGSEWSKRWAEAKRTVTCELCSVETPVAVCEKCVGDKCDVYVHRVCIDPLRQDWSTFDGFVCEDCDDACVICGDEYEFSENQLIVCDECDALFHVLCLDDADRPPPDEIGDDSAEWLCPECVDEYASDTEWAAEHIVNEDDMQREDCFSRSTCPCDVCKSMNNAADSWGSFSPSNPIQRSLKAAIDSREGIVADVMDNLHMRHGLPPPS